MIRIPKSIYTTILEHAKREKPLECCGILSGRDGTVEKAFELRNKELSPVRYSMSPQDQLKVFEELEKEAMEMVAIYHSHPETVAFPSETDVKMSFYPDLPCIIISLRDDDHPKVKAFLIRRDGIKIEEIEVT